MLNDNIKKTLNKFIKRWGSDELLYVLNGDEYVKRTAKNNGESKSDTYKKDAVNTSITLIGFEIMAALIGGIMASVTMPSAFIPFIAPLVLIPVAIATILPIAIKKINTNLDKFVILTENYSQEEINLYIKQQVKEKYNELKEKGDLNKIKKFKILNGKTLIKLSKDNEIEYTTLSLPENKIVKQNKLSQSSKIEETEDKTL